MSGGNEIQRGAWTASRFAARAAAVALLAGLSLLLFVNLGIEPPGRKSETRCQLVAQKMVESGDWLVPHLGRKVRLQKPPLFYWAGAATATLLGDTGTIAVRLPSALAAVALAAVVIRWGGALGGHGMGLAAGAALVAMIQIPASGRRGDAEMLLALLCFASLFVFDRAHATRHRALLPLFGVLAGLAFLTKATAVLLIVALPILVFLALQHQLGRLRDRGVLASCGLAFAIGLSWYAAILAVVPGAFETLWNDLLMPLGAAPQPGKDAAHFRPIWWYVAVLPARAAPASLLLPVVAWRLWTTRVYSDEPRLRFAALTFLVPFVAFSLLPQKQNHYTLAMLPGLALLCAESITALAPRGRAWIARVFGTPLALAGLVGTGLLALFFVWIDGWSVLPVALVAGVVLSSFAIALGSALRGRAVGFALAWVPAFLLAYGAQRSVVVVRVEEMERQGIMNLSLDERERLYEVAREHPWFLDLFQISRRGDTQG